MRMAGMCYENSGGFCLLDLDRELARQLLKFRERIRPLMFHDDFRAAEFADGSPKFFEDADDEDMREQLLELDYGS